MREKNERHSDNRPVFARRTFRLPVDLSPGRRLAKSYRRSAVAHQSANRASRGDVTKARDTRCFVSWIRRRPHVVGFSLVFCYFFYFFGRGPPLARRALSIARRAARRVIRPSARASRAAPSSPLFLSSFGDLDIVVLGSFLSFLSVCSFARSQRLGRPDERRRCRVLGASRSPPRSTPPPRAPACACDALDRAPRASVRARLREAIAGFAPRGLFVARALAPQASRFFFVRVPPSSCGCVPVSLPARALASARARAQPPPSPCAPARRAGPRPSPCPAAPPH